MKAPSVMSKHDCKKHGHAWRTGPWGEVCAFCGVPLQNLARDIVGHRPGLGHWVALGEHSRIWVPR